MTEDQLVARTLKAGKDYGFSKRDTTRPWGYWFQEDQVGTVLFVVFYTKACRWAQCTGCNLPSQMSGENVTLQHQLQQVDWIFEREDIRQRAHSITKIIVSNNGSVLDQDTFANTTLVYLIAKCNLWLSALKHFTLETRAEYVELNELEFLARVLKEGETPTALELAIGFEIYNEELRNTHFLKGMPNTVFLGLVNRVRPFGFSIKAYFMQKPVVGMTTEEAIQDVVNGIRFLSEVSRDSGVSISMHLNPCYAAKGTPLEKAFLAGTWVPPNLTETLQALERSQGFRTIPVFVGLYDEGLACKGGSFMDYPNAKEAAAKLEHWNRTQELL